MQHRATPNQVVVSHPPLISACIYCHDQQQCTKVYCFNFLVSETVDYIFRKTCDFDNPSHQKCCLPTSTFGLSGDAKIVIDLEWPKRRQIFLLNSDNCVYSTCCIDYEPKGLPACLFIARTIFFPGSRPTRFCLASKRLILARQHLSFCTKYSTINL